MLCYAVSLTRGADGVPAALYTVPSCQDTDLRVRGLPHCVQLDISRLPGEQEPAEEDQTMTVGDNAGKPLASEVPAGEVP